MLHQCVRKGGQGRRGLVLLGVGRCSGHAPVPAVAAVGPRRASGGGACSAAGRASGERGWRTLHPTERFSRLQLVAARTLAKEMRACCPLLHPLRRQLSFSRAAVGSRNERGHAAAARRPLWWRRRFRSNPPTHNLPAGAWGYSDPRSAARAVGRSAALAVGRRLTESRPNSQEVGKICRRNAGHRNSKGRR